METIGIMIIVFCALVWFICLIIAMLQMADIHGWLMALLGFFLCQIGVYIWGWIRWKAPEQMLIMLIWTGSFLGLIIGQAIMSTASP